MQIYKQATNHEVSEPSYTTKQFQSTLFFLLLLSLLPLGLPSLRFLGSVNLCDCNCLPAVMANEWLCVRVTMEW